MVLGSGAAERIEFGNSTSKLDFDQYKIKRDLLWERARHVHGLVRDLPCDD